MVSLGDTIGYYCFTSNQDMEQKIDELLSSITALKQKIKKKTRNR